MFKLESKTTKELYVFLSRIFCYIAYKLCYQETHGISVRKKSEEKLSSIKVVIMNNVANFLRMDGVNCKP